MLAAMMICLSDVGSHDVTLPTAQSDARCELPRDVTSDLESWFDYSESSMEIELPRDVDHEGGPNDDGNVFAELLHIGSCMCSVETLWRDLGLDDVFP